MPSLYSFAADIAWHDAMQAVCELYTASDYYHIVMEAYILKRPFIIGNGFDVAHGLPTKYENFHKYLREEYPDADETTGMVPTRTNGHHGEMEYDNNEVVGYLLNLISRTEGENWSDLETTLGELDFEYDFDDLPEETDKDGEPNLWHSANNNEDLAAELAGCVPTISDLFSDWVDTIDISSAAMHKDSVFSGKADFAHDLFLSFNYTFTLENVYGAKNVCHIHGCQGGKLLFGHGAGHLYGENHPSNYVGCEDGLESIQDALRKDTNGAIASNKLFFNSLSSDIEEIYSYGLSFGIVDLVYLREIFQHLDTSGVTWYLHNFDASKHKKQKDLIKSHGFCGGFNTFG